MLRARGNPDRLSEVLPTSVTLLIAMQRQPDVDERRVSWNSNPG
jgi:hypothetical protein